MSPPVRTAVANWPAAPARAAATPALAEEPYDRTGQPAQARIGQQDLDRTGDRRPELGGQEIQGAGDGLVDGTANDGASSSEPSASRSSAPGSAAFAIFSAVSARATSASGVRGPTGQRIDQCAHLSIQPEEVHQSDTASPIPLTTSRCLGTAQPGNQCGDLRDRRRHRMCSIHPAAASRSRSDLLRKDGRMPNEATVERAAGPPVVVAAAGATVAVAPDSSRRLRRRRRPSRRRGGGKIGTAGPPSQSSKPVSGVACHRTAGSGGGHHGHSAAAGGNPRDPRDDGSGGRRKVYRSPEPRDDRARVLDGAGATASVVSVDGAAGLSSRGGVEPIGSDTAAGSAANRRNRPGRGHRRSGLRCGPAVRRRWHQCRPGRSRRVGCALGNPTGCRCASLRSCPQTSASPRCLRRPCCRRPRAAVRR